ncbi:MAG: ABC transporter permease [Isosphaeraceae bacterium]|nr:ABC transporter permease [Isosphaeraceae bacterium]
MADPRTSKTASKAIPHEEYFPSVETDRESAFQRWARRLSDDRIELTRYLPVVQNMVVQELRVRYQRSVLGFLWTLLNPILMMTTMTIVFSQIFRIDARTYSVYLFSGLVPWTFLSSSLNDSAFCIIQNESLIRKIYLPKSIFPITRVLINLSTFVLSFVALFIFLWPLGARPSWAMLFLPAAIGLFAVFTLGLSLILATANTFFRDCGHLVAVFLQAWYFLTPILYEAKDLSPEVRNRFWLNPAYPFVRLFQAIIRDGVWPDPPSIAAASAFALISLGVGYVVFKSHEDKLVFRL